MKVAPPPKSEPDLELDAQAETEEVQLPKSAAEPAAREVSFEEDASPEFRKKFERLAAWVRGRKGRVHAALVDLESDKWLLRSGAEEPVNPASNAKILTAAAALELLGPAYQFSTELFGTVGADGKCERLVLKGGGAPDLTTADLYRLVRVALGEGLTEVREIVVDQSRFTSDYLPPAFGQQPGEWAPFRAPVSALAINQNAISLNVVPKEAGSAARVWYDPPGVIQHQGQVTSSKKGSGDRVTWNLDVKKNPQLPVSNVGGSLAEGAGRRRYERRMEDPRLAGGLALAQLLRDAGVGGELKVSLGKKQKEPRIALWYSEPIAELVRALGKDSNNFVAEMLFVALSSSLASGKGDQDKPWSSESGAKALTEWLSKKGVDLSKMVIKNGSGLFDANRLSAEVLVKVLALVQDNPRIYQDFVSHLAMGQTDGTMKRRMRQQEIGARIRAKTGTLNDVDSLSGYVQRPGGRAPAAFSIIVVGAEGSHADVRNKVDELVLAWANLLE